MFKKDLLKNKRILVTGGGTGLGKEMASHYAEHGAEVHNMHTILLLLTSKPLDNEIP